MGRRKINKFMNYSYIDFQINGYMGIDFSSPTLTLESCEKCFKDIIKSGISKFCPTIITSPMKVYRRNIPIVIQILQKTTFKKHILGIHLEGPFFSQTEALGAHNPNYTLLPEKSLIDELIDLSDGKIKLITLGADLPKITKHIEYITGKGIIVSLGHHIADYKMVNESATAGASLLTHLGNGLPKLLNRHDNPIFAGLACEKLKVMFIGDGHHLPDELITIFKEVKGVDNLLLTSDAAPLSGLKPGLYSTLGNNVELTESGKIFNHEKNCLVGSASMMNSCVNYLLKKNIFSEDEIKKITHDNQIQILENQPKYF